jgi:hypothetical protein
MASALLLLDVGIQYAFADTDMAADLLELDSPFLDQPAREPLSGAQQCSGLFHV